MSFDVFLNFDGDCRDALEFYAGVFGLDMPEMQFYGDGSGRVLYAALPVFGCNLMFSDCPADFRHVKGNNFALTLGTSDKDLIARLFNALAQGGQVHMPLGTTFFSEYYGMATDRFGITWQLSA